MDRNRIFIKRLFVCMLMWMVAGVYEAIAQVHDPDTVEVLSAIVRDRKTRDRLAHVSVTVVGTSMGTVTNTDGVFAIKVPRRLQRRQIEVSHMGYRSERLTLAVETGDRLPVVWLTPVARNLGEVVIYGGNARRIIETALAKIPANYPDTPTTTSVFYRETVQKRHRFTSVSEGMLDVYKTAYKRRDVSRDKVRLAKARRLMSQKKGDTLAIKVEGGPNLALCYDVVKNGDALFDSQTVDWYAFELESTVMLDRRPQYVISFKPRVFTDYALMVGKVYVDCERLSFTKAEFSLDLTDRDRAVASILHRKPAGLRFRPLALTFLVSYRQHDGVTRLNYIGSEMRFKCDWKRRWFSSSYTVRSEMVTVDHRPLVSHAISPREVFGTKQIFDDLVDEYGSEDFWRDYNIIEPTESLENAVRKLRKNR